MDDSISRKCNWTSKHLVCLVIFLSGALWSSRDVLSNAAGTTTKAPPVNSPAGTQVTPKPQTQPLPVFTINYPRIQVPFEITLWILLASFAKIGKSSSRFHNQRGGFLFVSLLKFNATLELYV